MTKRRIDVPEDLVLPALTTEIKEQAYSFGSFLHEWVLGAPGMRKDENLKHLFSLEYLIKDPPKAKSKLYLDEDVWTAAKAAAKEAVDEAMRPDMMGRQRLPLPWALQVLRHYHVLSQAQAVEDTDIPKADGGPAAADPKGTKAA